MLTHLYLSRVAVGNAPSHAWKTRWFVRSMNVAMLTAPTLFPIGQSSFPPSPVREVM